MPFDMNEKLELGCVHIEKDFSLGEGAWLKKEGRGLKIFPVGFAPGPPMNPVTKLPGSKPVYYSISPKESESTNILKQIFSKGSITVL